MVGSEATVVEAAGADVATTDATMVVVEEDAAEAITVVSVLVVDEDPAAVLPVLVEVDVEVVEDPCAVVIESLVVVEEP